MDLYQAEAARGWYKWIYIRQRQPGVGINGFISGRGSREPPGLGIYNCQDLLCQAEAASRVGINGFISGRGSPGLV